VSEPADAPQPEPEKYPWKEPRDRELDVLALVTCGVLVDYDAAVDIIESLDDAQRVSAIWVLARWYSCLLAQHVENPLAELQELALILAKGRGEAA
jgi:hypothetical protein